MIITRANPDPGPDPHWTIIGDKKGRRISGSDVRSKAPTARGPNLDLAEV